MTDDTQCVADASKEVGGVVFRAAGAWLGVLSFGILSFASSSPSLAAASAQTALAKREQAYESPSPRAPVALVGHASEASSNAAPVLDARGIEAGQAGLAGVAGEADVPTVTYLVLPGEDLISIAERFGVHAKDVCRANGGRIALEPGDAIRVPSHSEAPVRRRVQVLARAGETVEELAARFDLEEAQLRWLNRWAVDHEPKTGDVVIAFAPLLDVRAGMTLEGEVFHSRFEEPTRMPEQPELYILKSPDAAWGTRGTIDALTDIARSHRRAFPAAPLLVLGDISRRWGGRFRPHVSHRRGNDVDIGLPMSNGEAPLRFMRLGDDRLDVPRAWELIRSSVATGHTQYIFIDYRLQLPIRAYAKELGLTDSLLDELFQVPQGRGKNRGIVRHERGHRDHIHIRFDHDVAYASETLVNAMRAVAPGSHMTPDVAGVSVEERCRSAAASAMTQMLLQSGSN